MQPTRLSDLTVPILWDEWGSHRLSSQTTKTASQTVKFVVNWTDVWEFVRQVNGIFITPNGDGTTTTTYRFPLECPDNPLLLVQATGESEGLSPGLPCAPSTGLVGGYTYNFQPYKFAKIPVTFGTPVYETSGDNTLLSFDRDGSGEFLKAPFGVYRCDGVPSENIGLYIPSTAYSVTRYRATSVNDDLIDSLRGKVNSSSIFGRDPGTLLFDSVRTSTTVDFGGATLTTIAYSFNWRSVDWNYDLSPVTGNFAPVTPPRYATDDFGPLFN